MKNKKQGLLLKNTVLLYVLTFSNYFFSFISVPYQTRILGPEIYGDIGFAQALMVYVQLFLDFGFLLSATEDVARNRNDSKELSRILSAVLICKLVLATVALCITIGVCLSVVRFRENMLLYLLFFVATFFSSLLPDFLYRGMEKMSAITYRTVAVKAFFTLAIVLVLKNRDQVYLIPIFNALGGFGACLWAYYDLNRNYKVRFTRVSTEYVWKTIRRSSGYFVSRIASTVYSATNTVIIGFLHPAGSMLGYYSSAERLTNTARNAFSPIADSLYPYMVNQKDYRLVKRILLILMPLVIVGCTIVGIYAEFFCVLLFGEEFAYSSVYLRLLMPTIVLALPTYLCGFPMLSPMGLSKYANISVVFGAIWHAVVLLVMYATNTISVESICIATCVTECVVFSIRVFVIVKNRNK